MDRRAVLRAGGRSSSSSSRGAGEGGLPPPAVLEGAERVRLVLARQAGEPSPHEALLLCDAKAPFQAVLGPGGCLPVPEGVDLGARPVLGGLLEVGVFLRLAATGEGWYLRYRLYPARGAGDFAATVLAPGDSSRLPEGPLYLGGLPRGRPSFRHPLLLAPCSLPTPQGCQGGYASPPFRPPRGAVADLSAPYPSLSLPRGYHLGPFAALRLSPRGRGVEVRLSDGRRLYTEGAGRPLLLGGRVVERAFSGVLRAGLLRVEGGEAGSAPLVLAGGRVEALPVRGEALALVAEGLLLLHPGRYRALVGSLLDRAEGREAVVEGSYVGFRPLWGWRCGTSPSTRPTRASPPTPPPSWWRPGG